MKRRIVSKYFYGPTKQATEILTYKRERDNTPISFVLNWYTPTSTPTVAALSVQVAIGPKTGNFRL